jgi:hypoxanthine phosphoribosyltransferase
MAEKLNVLFTQEQIIQTISRLAAEIKRDYQGKQPLLVAILKGSFVFLADLIRELDMPLEVDFVKLSSYGSGKTTSGKVKMVQGLNTPIQERDVLIVEDIVDTGLTLSSLLEHLRRKKPASLKLCALADKPSRRKVPVTIDYLGLTVPDKFIVGYGIDWDEKFRYLPNICILD